MKTLLLSGLLCVGAAAFADADPLLTFDDVASVDGAAIGPGYHLLNWPNFHFVVGTNNAPSGYAAGVVSGRFVIYDNLGVSATISGGMFDFVSAYATAAWNDNLQLEVQGYFKGTLLYDQTDVLSATAPTLINYHFYGVDEVVFTPSGGTHHAGYSGAGTQFVLDNISVHTYVPYLPTSPANGGFETGDFSGWSLGGNTNFTFVSTNSIYVHSGTYGAQLGPYPAPGYLSQQIPTAISQLYTVSFWLKDTTNAVGATTPNSFVLNWGGFPVFGLTNAGLFDWTNISLTLQASRPSEILQFQYADSPGFFGLDDVSVTPAVLVNNGGFETGDFSGWAQTGITTYNSVMPSAKHVGFFGGQFGPVGGFGSILQSIVTQPGQPYLISAWLNTLPTANQTNQFRVSWSGQVLDNRANLPAAGWTNLHYTALNGNSENTLQFGFRNDPWFFLFDEASVWPLPILQNGGFEFGDFTGWTTGGNFTFCSVQTNASSGYYGAYLGPQTTLGSLTQTFATVPGQSYLIGFMLNNLFAETNLMEFNVSWNGTALMDITNLNLFGWIPYEFAVTAPGTNATLQFGFDNYYGYWGLDDVFVVPITAPEFESITKNGTNVDLTWNVMPDYLYQVQYATNLTQPNWKALMNFTGPTNIPMSTTDTNPPDAERFYRVRMIPPPLLF